MTTTKREFAPGNYYHIYTRGNSKQKIFLDEGDKNRFVDLLYLCNGEVNFKYAKIPEKEIFDYSFDRGNLLVEICAWVLMSNHFHLLIFVPETMSAKNISKFMARLLASYLHYFNKKNNRTGGLFEGRFQAILVDEDNYLKYLYSYIHLNPLKMLDENWKQNLKNIKNARNYLNDYKYSSYHDLVTKSARKENKIISTNQKVLEISQIANTLDKLFSLIPTPGWEKIKNS